MVKLKNIEVCNKIEAFSEYRVRDNWAEISDFYGSEDTSSRPLNYNTV